jgi:hypothetical protein
MLGCGDLSCCFLQFLYSVRVWESNLEKQCPELQSRVLRQLVLVKRLDGLRVYDNAVELGLLEVPAEFLAPAGI